MSREEQTVFEMVGGEPTFKQLVEVFYAKVEADDVLRAIFPEDLEPGKRWQQLFLMQFFGGPTMYAEERGHPRLRMRHMPFPIDAGARDRWLGHMLAAIDEVGIQEPAREMMRSYFERAADHMINVFKPSENAYGETESH
ncbi:MAG: globin [Anaerolineae bacterium]